MAIELAKDSELMENDGGYWVSRGIDLQIYANAHPIRVPNTVHEKSKLWKVYVPEPIFFLEPSVLAQRIQEVAQEKGITFKPVHKESEAAKKLGRELCGRMESGFIHVTKKEVIVPTSQFSIQTMLNRGTPGSKSYISKRQRTLEVLEGPVKESVGIRDLSGRNSCLMHLVGTFTMMEIPVDYMRSILLMWARYVCEPPLDPQEVIRAISGYHDT